MTWSKLLLSVNQLPQNSQCSIKSCRNPLQKMSPGSVGQHGRNRHIFIYGSKYSRTVTKPLVTTVVLAWEHLTNNPHSKSHENPTDSFSSLYVLRHRSTDRQQESGSDTPKMGVILNPQRLILANNQLDALFHVFIYFSSLRVSSIIVLIIRRSNCINL